MISKLWSHTFANFIDSGSKRALLERDVAPLYEIALLSFAGELAKANPLNSQIRRELSAGTHFALPLLVERNRITATAHLFAFANTSLY